jgi:hypothetical protein
MDKTNESDADELAQRNAQEVTPQELWNRLWGNGVIEDGFVVAVDPEDMKNACRMGQEAQAAAIGQSALQSVCSPEANAIAIWYRLRMLGLCAELLSAYTHDGEFTDAVFQVAAKFPMKRMETDVTYQGPPFDVEEFMRQVERASAEQV